MIDWKVFKDEKPPEIGLYLYVCWNGWEKARWDGEGFSMSCGARRTKLVEPDFWAVVELP